jgi:beta-glucosidase
VENIRDELVRLLEEAARVSYVPGLEAGAEGLAQAREAARAAAVAVVVVGLPGSYEEEGADRKHIDLPPEHNELVEAVLEAQPRTVVVLLNGSSVTMPWAERTPAILEGWLGGQGGGGGIADVLLGRVNPSGKLAESFPARLEDTPAHLSFPHDGAYRVPFGEGLFTGYRWYDARRIEPLYPFGHGLSYTSFEYSDLRVESSSSADGGGPEVMVSLTVRNTGSRAGKEVVQLYVREQEPPLTRPEKELKAFAKVALEPGEQREVSLRLDKRDFTVYHPRAAAWTITSSTFEILVGASSRDIRLRESLTLEGVQPFSPPLDRLSPLGEWLAKPVGRERVQPVIGALRKQLFGSGAELSAEEAKSVDMVESFLHDMPIAKLVMFGALSEAELEAMVEAANTDESRS